MAKQKLTHFVGLRGLCMIPVYAHHAWIDFWFERPRPVSLVNDWRTLWLMNGPFCLGIFFTLSGRLLARSLYHQNDPAKVRKWLASTILRRPFRLLLPPLAILYCFRIIAATPLLSATLAQFDAVVKPFGPVHAEDGDMHVYADPEQAPTWLRPVRDMRGVIRWEWPHYVVFWTLPYQLWMSYLVFALAIVATQYRRMAGALLVVAPMVTSLLGFGYHVGYFILGLAFCHFAESRPRDAAPSAGRLTLSWLALAFSLFPLCGFLYPWEKNFLGTWLETLLGGDEYLVRLAGVAPLFFFVETNPVAHRALSHPWLVWFGGVSFQFYLTARFVTFLVGTWTLTFFLRPDTWSPTVPRPSDTRYAVVLWLVAFPVCTVASLFVAKLCTDYVDTPCARLIERAMAKLEGFEEAGNAAHAANGDAWTGSTARRTAEGRPEGKEMLEMPPQGPSAV